MDNDERHRRKFRQILQEKGVRGELVIDDSDVSCDVRKGNCKLLLDKYELDCKNSKVTQKNMNMENPVGLPERLKNAKKNAGLCKDGRLDYIKSCCRSKTNERALATDMGHLIQIVKMQNLEDFIVSELERKAEERRVREAEKKERDAEERRVIEAERKEREAEERRVIEAERKAKEEERRAERKAKEEERRAERKAKEEAKEEERKAKEEEKRVKEEAEKEVLEKRHIAQQQSKMPPVIENKITRFLLKNKHKLTDIARVIELCGSVYERILKISDDLQLLKKINVVLNVITLQLTPLIGVDDTNTVLEFLVQFLVKKIRGKRPL